MAITLTGGATITGGASIGTGGSSPTPDPYVFQGSNYGYTSGGSPDEATGENTIDKFPFTSDSNATDVGDLTQAKFGVSGQSSSASGYTSSGYDGSALTDVIEKFPFSSDGNATDVGDLTQARNVSAGQQY